MKATAFHKFLDNYFSSVDMKKEDTKIKSEPGGVLWLKRAGNVNQLLDSVNEFLYGPAVEIVDNNYARLLTAEEKRYRRLYHGKSQELQSRFARLRSGKRRLTPEETVQQVKKRRKTTSDYQTSAV